VSEVESWRTKADIEADCLNCDKTWRGRGAYASGKRHAGREGHRVHVEVHHTVVYKPARNWRLDHERT
jgi:hypothetical protein